MIFIDVASIINITKSQKKSRLLQKIRKIYFWNFSSLTLCPIIKVKMPLGGGGPIDGGWSDGVRGDMEHDKRTIGLK